jgi:hypothetical protein
MDPFFLDCSEQQLEKFRCNLPPPLPLPLPLLAVLSRALKRAEHRR